MDPLLLEWLAALTGLLSVYLTTRGRLACWPVGLISVSAYAVFFVELKLYADAGLQGFFFLTSLHGWYHWARGGPDHGRAAVIVLGKRARVLLGVSLASVAAGLGAWLAHRTDASLPYWDALIATLSVAAQLLLMRKYLDSWPLWVMVDVLSLFVYAAKGAWITCGLYALFLGLALYGWSSWHRARTRGVAL